MAAGIHTNSAICEYDATPFKRARSARAGRCCMITVMRCRHFEQPTHWLPSSASRRSRRSPMFHGSPDVVLDFAPRQRYRHTEARTCSHRGYCADNRAYSGAATHSLAIAVPGRLRPTASGGSRPGADFQSALDGADKGSRPYSSRGDRDQQQE